MPVKLIVLQAFSILEPFKAQSIHETLLSDSLSISINHYFTVFLGKSALLGIR